MAFPNTPIRDTFDRADGVLGGNWSSPALGDSASPTIETNLLRFSAAAQSSACWNGNVFADGEVYFTVPTLSAVGDHVRLLGRCDTATLGAQNSYRALWVQSSGDIFLSKFKGGVQQSDVFSGSAVRTVSAGDSLGMSMAGGLITLWYKAAAGASFSSVISGYDDGALSAGYMGVGAGFGITVEPRLNNFGGGPTPAASSLLTPRSLAGRGANR
jgi:hypothetical protein